MPIPIDDSRPPLPLDLPPPGEATESLRQKLQSSRILLVHGPPGIGKHATLSALAPSWRFLNTLEGIQSAVFDSENLIIRIPNHLIDEQGYPEHSASSLVNHITESWRSAIQEVLKQREFQGKVVFEGRSWPSAYLLQGLRGHLPQTKEEVLRWLRGFLGEFSLARSWRWEIHRHRISEVDATSTLSSPGSHQWADGKWMRQALSFSRLSWFPFHSEYSLRLLGKARLCNTHDLEETRKEQARALGQLSPHGVLPGLLTISGTALITESPSPPIATFLAGLPQVAAQTAGILIPGGGAAILLLQFLQGRRKERSGDASALLNAHEGWHVLERERKEILCDQLDRTCRFVPGASWVILNSFLSGSRQEFKTILQKHSSEIEALRGAIDDLASAIEELRATYDEEVRGISTAATQFGIGTSEQGFTLTPRLTTTNEIPLASTPEYESLVSRVGHGLQDGRIVVLRGPKGTGKSILARVALAAGLTSGDLRQVIMVDAFTSNPILLDKVHALVELNSVTLFYDPFAPSLYYPENTVEGPSPAYKVASERALDPQILNWIASRNRLQHWPALIVVPDDRYDDFVRLFPETTNDRLITIVVNLAFPEFLRQVVLFNCTGNLQTTDFADEAARMLSTFESGYTLSARLVGEVASSVEGQSRMIDIIRQAQGKAHRFFQYYIWFFVVAQSAEGGSQAGLDELATLVVVRSGIGPLPLPLALGLGPSIKIDDLTQRSVTVSTQPPPTIHDSSLLIAWFTKARTIDIPAYDASSTHISDCVRWVCQAHEDLIEEAISDLIGVSMESVVPHELLILHPFLASLRRAHTRIARGHGGSGELVHAQRATAIMLLKELERRRSWVGHADEVEKAIDQILVSFAQAAAGLHLGRSPFENLDQVLRSHFIDASGGIGVGVQLLVGHRPYILPLLSLLDIHREEYYRRLLQVVGEVTGSEEYSPNELVQMVASSCAVARGTYISSKDVATIVDTVSWVTLNAPRMAERNYETYGWWVIAWALSESDRESGNDDDTIVWSVLQFMDCLLSALPQENFRFDVDRPSEIVLNLVTTSQRFRIEALIQEFSVKYPSWTLQLKCAVTMTMLFDITHDGELAKMIMPLQSKAAEGGPGPSRLSLVEVMRIGASANVEIPETEIRLVDALTNELAKYSSEGPDAALTLWLSRYGLFGRKEKFSVWLRRLLTDVLWWEARDHLGKGDIDSAFKLMKEIEAIPHLDGQVSLVVRFRLDSVLRIRGAPIVDLKRDVEHLGKHITNDISMGRSLALAIATLHASVAEPGEIISWMDSDWLPGLLRGDDMDGLVFWAIVSLRVPSHRLALKVTLEQYAATVGPSWVAAVIHLLDGSLDCAAATQRIAQSTDLGESVTETIVQTLLANPNDPLIAFPQSFLKAHGVTPEALAVLRDELGVTGLSLIPLLGKPHGGALLCAVLHLYKSSPKIADFRCAVSLLSEFMRSESFRLLLESYFGEENLGLTSKTPDVFVRLLLLLI